MRDPRVTLALIALVGVTLYLDRARLHAQDGLIYFLAIGGLGVALVEGLRR